MQVAYPGLGTRPKFTVKVWEETWWRLPMRGKTSSFWPSRGSLHHQGNKCGSAWCGPLTASTGVITLFQSTKHGLQRNRMEIPTNHAATCGLGNPQRYLDQTVPGMTGFVQWNLTRPVAWCVKGSLELLTLEYRKTTLGDGTIFKLNHSINCKV